jgi:hypothetical protein
MTFRITIRRGGLRFSYYGVFANSLEASTNAARAAQPGERVSVKLWSAA